MGMLVTLNLISVNVFNSVDGPPGRGFSYIEIWMVGMQIPMLVALVEYSSILGLRKFLDKKIEMNNPKVFVNRSEQSNTTENTKFDESTFIMVDKITLILSIIFFVTFCLFYWTLLP